MAPPDPQSPVMLLFTKVELKMDNSPKLLKIAPPYLLPFPSI